MTDNSEFSIQKKFDDSGGFDLMMLIKQFINYMIDPFNDFVVNIFKFPGRRMT